MREAKRYYWLKLPEDFFRNRLVRKLKRLPGGDSYAVIYIELLLSSLATGGVIKILGCESSVEEELALVIDEDEDNVRVTIQYMKQYGMLIENDDEVVLPQAQKLTISEGSSAERVRNFRSRNALQSNSDALQCNARVTNCNSDALQSNVEKEIDIDIEKEKEIDIDIEKERKEKINKKEKFKPPTLGEVRAYCEEQGRNVDPYLWYDHYTSNGWKVGKTPMVDWRASIRTWERNGQNGDRQSGSTFDYLSRVIEGRT